MVGIERLVTPTVHANAAELQQLSSFYRLLNQAAAARSEREIIRVLVEALAVWQDVESWAYFADVTGRFVLDVSLPGSDLARVPTFIDQSRLPIGVSTPAKVSLSELEALGFTGFPQLLISRIQVRGATDWLVVTDDHGDADGAARLGVYVQAVVQTLSEADAIHASRLTWAMLEHLLPAGDSLVHAAQGALDALASSVDAAVWLTVVSKDGAPMLTAGDFMSVLARPVPTRAPGVLVIPVDIAGPHHATIGVRRLDDRLLTGRDEQLLRLAASTLSTWLSGAIDRLSTENERREHPHPFDQVLKRHIDDAMVHGQDISVIVVSLGPDLPRADVVHDYVARIRRELRPADMAGRLSSGLIGVFLPGTTAGHARVVIERLRHILDADPNSGMRASIALARLPGTDLERLPPEHTAF